MTSLNKKKKAHNTLYDRGGEKGKYEKEKKFVFFHKKDRARNKKICRDYQKEQV